MLVTMARTKIMAEVPPREADLGKAIILDDSGLILSYCLYIYMPLIACYVVLEDHPPLQLKVFLYKC